MYDKLVSNNLVLHKGEIDASKDRIAAVYDTSWGGCISDQNAKRLFYVVRSLVPKIPLHLLLTLERKIGHYYYVRLTLLIGT